MPNPGQVIRAADVAAQSCVATRTTTQSIPDSTMTTINFDTELFDNDNMHNSSSLTSRITITREGFYAFGYNHEMQGASDYIRVLAQILLNGTNTIARDQSGQQGGSVGQVINVSGAFYFQVGDYIEVQVFQDNSANAARSIQVIADRSPVFWATRIGS